jgi:hypothetical protein
MKKYIIEFTHSNGEKELVELTTDRIEWSIEQWKRNRSVVKHQIIESTSTSNKQMLLG